MCFYKRVFKNIGASLSCLGLDGTDKVYGHWDKYFLVNVTSCSLVIREAYQQLFKIWHFTWNAPVREVNTVNAFTVEFHTHEL